MVPPFWINAILLTSPLLAFALQTAHAADANPMSSNLYERLGVEKNATTKEITQAFRRLSKRFHTDIGGNAEAMTNLSVAFSTLKDEDTRAIYDRTSQTIGGARAPSRAAHGGAAGVEEFGGPPWAKYVHEFAGPEKEQGAAEAFRSQQAMQYLKRGGVTMTGFNRRLISRLAGRITLNPSYTSEGPQLIEAINRLPSKEHWEIVDRMLDQDDPNLLLTPEVLRELSGIDDPVKLEIIKRMASMFRPSESRLVKPPLLPRHISLIADLGPGDALKALGSLESDAYISWNPDFIELLVKAEPSQRAQLLSFARPGRGNLLFDMSRIRKVFELTPTPSHQALFISLAGKVGAYTLTEDPEWMKALAKIVDPRSAEAAKLAVDHGVQATPELLAHASRLQNPAQVDALRKLAASGAPLDPYLEGSGLRKLASVTETKAAEDYVERALRKLERSRTPCDLTRSLSELLRKLKPSSKP